MLNDIRDSLSHLRKSQLEADGEGIMQGKSELSQSTANLIDKSGTGAAKKGLENHHKKLAEIREALSPYKAPPKLEHNSDSDVSRNKVLQIMTMGVDEDIAVRALQLNNGDLNGAVKLLCTIIENHNGSNHASATAGLPSYPINRRPSFESKYGPSSPAPSEASARSDSPSQPARQPILNGHNTPPPLPPRAPIAPHGITHPPTRGQTPPPVGETTVVMAPNGIGSQNGQADVPPGHVDRMIKRMSPAGPPGQFRSQVVQVPHHQIPSSGPSSSSSSGSGGTSITIMPQRLANQRLMGGPSNSSTQRVPVALAGHLPHSQVMQHAHYHHHHCNSSGPNSSNGSSASSTPVLTGRVTISVSHPPPPPYQASQMQVSTEQSHLLSPQLTDYCVYAATGADSPLNLSTASSSQLSDSANGTWLMSPNAGLLPQGAGLKMVPGLPVMALRRPMAPHTPVIMQSVKSKEVYKPTPQTATIPMSPPAGPANYISQVQVNMGGAGTNGHGAESAPATTTTTARTPNLQIQITGRAPHRVLHSHPHNGPQLATEPLPPQGRGRPTIRINMGHPAYLPPHHHVQLQNFSGTVNDLYHRASSDTASTPRSDSPVSRTTNQSPLSVLSTTSSPSTNSDIPDKPPPPYPFGLQQGSGAPRQPPLPPRIPLGHKPPPPPPPGGNMHGVTLHLPPRTVVAASNVAQQSYPAVLTGVNNVNGQVLGGGVGNETASEQGDDTDTETVSSEASGGVGAQSGGNDKKGDKPHRCMSPMPQRRPNAQERDSLRCDTKVRNYSPQAFKFYMEQHVENVLKIHQQRLRRRTQLETEMAKVKLSEEAARQMRRMLHQKESNYIRLKRAKMDKTMFDKLKTLGVGAFGEVALVRKKDTGMLYAMKTLRKSDVLKRNQVAHVKAERDILAEADNEWVVKLYYSFQDHHNLYFVMDFVPGGDLMGLLIRMEILDEPLARFYVAELVQAIESVHRMGFIHRDIKPDNILIDRNGHIKLTDFGLCTGFRWTHNSKYYQRDGTHARQDSMEVNCQLDEQCHCEILKPLERRRKREQRCMAHSLVGTPNYIAPEVLMRSSGYTSVCDWWSVGVILFEMLIGHPPFYASTPGETQFKVIHWKDTLKIPRDSPLSQPAKDLIVHLCCGPDERLGLRGAGEIKAHPFFGGVNFDSLRKHEPPYVPLIRHATDTSNFDPVDPDKLRNSEESEETRKVERLENGKHPEHAFFEFTFRRFFDDGGHPMAPSNFEPKDFANLEPGSDPDSNSPVYV